MPMLLSPNRIALGVVLAIVPSLAAPEAADDLHAPIPIRFTLDHPGHVTIVIEDARGRRVRNLIAATHFDAGEHTVWWEGLDDGESIKLPRGAVHRIANRRLVEPGTYRARGLCRNGVDLVYEFSVNTGGDPPWFVGRESAASGGEPGGWLADHSPPADVLYLPGDRPPHYRAARLFVDRDGYAPDETLLIPSGPPLVMLCSPISEAGHGLVWCDLTGRKVAGIRSYGHGGRWFPGGYVLARDEGEDAVPGTYAYYGVPFRSSAHELKRGRIYIQAVPSDTTVHEPEFTWPTERGDMAAVFGGMAVRNGILVVALRWRNKLALVDVRSVTPEQRGKELGLVDVPDPGGLAFDQQGRLLVVSGNRLLRSEVDAARATLSQPEVLVADGLDDPQRLALDAKGHIYISDWGTSHQVKVFTPTGKPLRTIGRPGVPAAGPYDERRMNRPMGLTVTSDGRLWVAEHDRAPKRVSIWKLDGTFVRAMYGPTKYGGGGDIDGRDTRRFYYAEAGIGLEYRLNWKRGDARLTNVYYRRGPDDLVPPPRYLAPQRPIHLNGRTYMTNAYSAWATYGGNAIGIWPLEDGLIRPGAIVGSLAGWPFLIEQGIVPEIPPDTREQLDKQKREDRRQQILQQFHRETMFAWSDLNADAHVQPAEVTFRKAPTAVSQVTVGRDLSLLVTTSAQILRLRPRAFTDQGAPIYDPEAADVLVEGGEGFHLGGVNAQALAARDGTIVKVGAPLRGYRDGELMWTYHNQWPSLHAGHSAPQSAEYPGQLIATTRLLGWAIEPRGTDVELWAINGNRGVVYLMTTDGLFVARLGKYVTEAPQWRMPEARRGMLVNDVNFVGEHFWPTITQANDGRIYLVAGKEHNSIVRVDGLESIRRIPPTEIRVTPAILAEAWGHFARREALRQQQSPTVLTVALHDTPPTVDGDTGDWADPQWVPIDGKAQAALCVAGDRLYVGYRTEDPDLLKNSAESGLPLLFKTGGALDLMIAAEPGADPERAQPAPGDMRLLVTKVDDATVAALYRAKVPGTQAPLIFSSPARSITIDRVDDVSAQVELATAKRIEEKGTWRGVQRDTYYDYELSIPLDTLGLSPRPGLSVRGDVGLLRGQGGETVQRLYWHNKSTGLTSDVPSEAMLTPHLWGQWRFERQ